MTSIPIFSHESLSQCWLKNIQNQLIVIDTVMSGCDQGNGRRSMAEVITGTRNHETQPTLNHSVIQLSISISK